MLQRKILPCSIIVTDLLQGNNQCCTKITKGLKHRDAIQVGVLVGKCSALSTVLLLLTAGEHVYQSPSRHLKIQPYSCYS